MVSYECWIRDVHLIGPYAHNWPVLLVELDEVERELTYEVKVIVDFIEL